MERTRYIGGTDIGSILGVGFCDALEVWKRKTGRETGKVEGTRLDVGLQLESYILDDYEKKTGHAVTRRQDFFSEEFKEVVLGGTVDGICEFSRTLVDAKVHFGYEYESDELPTKYFLQAQWYMYLTKCVRADFHVLHLSRADFKTYEVLFDAELCEELKEVANDFWGLVLRDEPPSPVQFSCQGSASEYVRLREEKLSECFREEKTKKVASFEAECAHFHLKELYEQKKALEEECKSLEAVLAVELAGSDVLVSDSAGFELAKAVRKKDTKDFLRMKVCF